jgi:two-component system, NarL family, response regulator LiaR
MIKILLVDDQAMVRQGLKMQFALERDLNVVGEAGNGKIALELVQVLQPDLVIMDVEMPIMDGITATKALHDLTPQIPVIVLSLHGDQHTRLRAEEAGAAAFVEKSGGIGLLLEAIRRAAPLRPASDQ